jgi:hydroxyacylglutathione hydrolase
MLVEDFFDEGLGNSSYLAAAEGSRTAVAIDPQRDVDRYVEAAARRGWTITHSLETHLHADFVSGSRELAARTGAAIVASAAAGLRFPHRAVADGETFTAAGLCWRAMSTPGHTPEHVCFLVLDPAGAPQTLFSGGNLLPGSAARTDLIGPECTDRLTRALYHSLHDRILALPDPVTVLPTHGAGSFCAAGARAQRSTTIGIERRTNPLIGSLSEDAFVRRALADLPAYPDYFLRMRPLNQAGPSVLGGLPAPAPRSPAAVRNGLQQGAILLDARPPEAFDAEHIPGSLGIPLSPAFGSWAGWMLPADARLVLLLASRADLDEAVRQLIRVGSEGFEGYLEGGMAAWRAEGYETVSIPRIAAETVPPSGSLLVVDVREPPEWSQNHIPGAVSLPLSELRERLSSLPREPLLVHCAHEFRSTIANSLLERAGFRVSHLVGGFAAWRQASGVRR